jgi:hypothetical protein
LLTAFSTNDMSRTSSTLTGFDQAFGDEKAQIFAETLFMTAASGDIPFRIMLLKSSRFLQARRFS